MHEKAFITSPIKDRRTRVIVLGPPGAGKTTMALSLSKMWDGCVLTASSVLSKYIVSLKDSRIVDEIKQHFLTGRQYDSDEFYRYLLKSANETDASVVLIDGFPRTQAALDYFKAYFLDKNEVYQHILFHVYAPSDLCRARFLSKSPNNSISIFESRMDHYQRTERDIIRSLSDAIPTIEIASFHLEN